MNILEAYNGCQLHVHKIEAVMAEEFMQFFLHKGYEEIPSISIKNETIDGKRHDTTVDIIGSGTNVYKNLLINDTIPETGACIVQPCVRTHMLKYMEQETLPIWKSTFKQMCVLAPHDTLSTVVKQTMQFLLDVISIPSENVCIRIQSCDKDLMEACRGYEQLFELDTKNPKYYTHTYGIGATPERGAIVGRNCNVAVYNKSTGKHEDIGNIIIIEEENTGRKYGIEVGIGITTCITHILGLSHTTDTSYIATILPGHTPNHIKLRDCIETAITLTKEGIRPQRHKGGKYRHLSDYIKSIYTLCAKIGYSMGHIYHIINQVIAYEIQDVTHAKTTIFILHEYLHKCEQNKETTMCNFYPLYTKDDLNRTKNHTGNTVMKHIHGPVGRKHGESK